MITLRQGELFQLPLRLRMPFRYGIATLTELPHAIVRLTFEIEGRAYVGFAADNLPPKWFTKDPARAPAGEIVEMWESIRAALRHAAPIQAGTPFAFWRELYAAQPPSLLTNLGTSLIERALLDAFCRARGITFASALRDNALGFDLGSLHPPLAGSTPRDWLPPAPNATVFARHTVGLSDPLDAGELPPANRAGDGLPQTLAECIGAYGLRHFKIKINGDLARDPIRLTRIAAVLAAECGSDYAFSLDGNESFRDVASFVEYARGIFMLPGLREFWPRLLFIEQPWHREVALSDAIGGLAHTWPDRPPIIIDESDADLDSLPRALERGYVGTSHKNCKGVFKSVANACLLAQRRRAGQPGLLSGEDLTNVGPIALTQDLAAAAALGIASVERNGHHYFTGLTQFPLTLQAHALAHHGDLFVRSDRGWPRVNVRDGEIALGTVNAAHFGVAGEPDLSGLSPVPTS
jgi:hypothetical protein